jgi:hypothetical protein
MFEIVNRRNKTVLYRSETATDAKAAVAEVVSRDANLGGADLRYANLRDANLGGANLEGANLRGANLLDANLGGANLGGADLRDANLRDANLGGANLGGADLRDANLRDANLRGANLGGADLRGADLEGANLRGADLRCANLGEQTVMPHGEIWREYLDFVVPQLCIAGGKPLETVACAEHWDCHDWNNCPMAVAFDIHDENEAPILLRPRVKEFVLLFDSKLIPMPKAAR